MNRTLATLGAAMVALALTALAGWAAGNVVLLHGIRNDASVWTGTRVEQQLGPGNDLKICTRIAITTGWTDPVANQANVLRNTLNQNGYLQAIGVGYSMGGYNMREYLREELLAGRTPRIKTAVTMGSFHKGAPIIPHLLGQKQPTVLNVIGAIANAVLLSGTFRVNADGTITYWYESGEWWTVQLSHAMIAQLYFAFMGQTIHAASSQDFIPSSQFCQNLIAAEPLESGITRIGIAGRENFPEIYRIGASAGGYSKGDVVSAFGLADAILWFRFWYFWDQYERYGNPQDAQTAQAYLSRAIVLDIAPSVWNQFVVEDHGEGNDAVVPTWSQYYPGALNYTAQGVNHLDYMKSQDVTNIVHNALIQVGTNGGAYGEPRAPAIVGPAGNIPSCPELTWDTDCMAADYQVQVATTLDFAAPLVLDQEGIVASRKDVSGLTAGASYFWRVRARNAAGYGLWSETAQFRMVASLVFGSSPPWSVSDWIGSLGPGDHKTITFFPEPSNCSYTFTYRVLDGRPDNYHINWSGNRITFYNDGVFGTFTLHVEVTAHSTYGTAVTTVGAAFVPTGGGCPYVAAWDGRGFVDDNNLLPAVELEGNAGRRVSDAYKLNLAPAEQDGRYRIALREFEREESEFDHAALFAVDHPRGTRMTLAADGRPVVWRMAAPLRATTTTADPALRRSILPDERLEAGSRVALTPREPGSRGARPMGVVLRGAAPSKQSPSAVISARVDGVPHAIAFRQRTTEVAVELPVDGASGLELQMRQDATLSDAQLVEILGSGWEVRELALAAARDANRNDVSAPLLTVDGSSVRLEPGQTIELDFEAPELAPGMVRSFFIRASGTYRHLADPAVTRNASDAPVEWALRPAAANEVEFSLGHESQVAIELFDVAGRRQATLLQSRLPAGTHAAGWNPRELAGGIYFIRLSGHRLDTGAGFESRRKIIVNR